MEFDPSLNSNNSSSEDDGIGDQDVCGSSDIENEFICKYYISSEESISLRKVYLLHGDKTRLLDKVAVGSSNGVGYIYDVNYGKLSRSITIDNISSENSIPICGVKFLYDNENLILMGTNDGILRLYDLRTNQSETKFEDKEGDKLKPITNFDINVNSRIICAGTERVGSDSYLLFFDIRKSSLLGGYWKSHQDDVTAVKFHPTNPDCLSTGSSEGLINIFDLAENTEDEALKIVINSESGVQKLNWHKNVYNRDLLSCITDINDLNIYNDEGDILSQFPRSNVTTAVRRTSVNDCILINCHNLISGNIFLLAGTNFNKGEMLRSVHVNDKKLVPHGNFHGNKQIIRESMYSSEKDMLITIGESGIVSLWGKDELSKPIVADDRKFKTKVAKNLHKQKPY